MKRIQVDESCKKIICLQYLELVVFQLKNELNTCQFKLHLIYFIRRFKYYLCKILFKFHYKMPSLNLRSHLIVSIFYQLWKKYFLAQFLAIFHLISLSLTEKGQFFYLKVIKTRRFLNFKK